MGTIEAEYGKSAIEKIFAGVDKLEKAVASTLGANGSNVIMVDNLNPPRVTKDGVSVARHFRLHDYIENAGADIVKQASISSADEAGDGSSTSVVLAAAMLKEGLMLPEEARKFDVRNGMDNAVRLIVKHLDSQSIPIEKDLNLLKSVARISANNNPSIGDVVAETVFELGGEAIIHISKEMKEKTEVVTNSGYKYEKPLSHSIFSHVEGDMYSKIENPKLLILDDSLNRIQDVLPAIKYCRDEKLPLVIMANKISNDIMTTIFKNLNSGAIDKYKFAIVETPNYNERRTQSLTDLVRCTGAKLFSFEETVGDNVKNFSPEDLGDLKSFESDSDSTTFIFTDEGSEQAELICKDLLSSIEKTTGAAKDRIEERLRRLSKGTATIYIGAKTEAESSELYDLFEDSLKACQSAIKEGVVVGGGLALLKAVNTLSPDTIKEELLNKNKIWSKIKRFFMRNKFSDEKRGELIVYKSCLKPFETIVKNSGVNHKKIFKSVASNKFTLGYDAKMGELANMSQRGILDPKKVTRVALESALSAAKMILTTNCVIYPYDFDKK